MTTASIRRLLSTPGLRDGDNTLRVQRVGADIAMLAGAGFVAWSAAIHLDLWQNGYRDIPTIGPLFLLQAISGFVLAALVVIARRLPLAVAGVGYLVATLGGLVWSVEWGLFGFQDSFTAPFAHASLTVEIVGAAALVVASALRIMCVRRSRVHRCAENER